MKKLSAIIALASGLCGWAGAQETTATKSGNDTSRIVSLNGSNTELIFALGLGKNVVARDDSAKYPKEVYEKIPSIGYQFKLNAEGILAQKPTLVIGRTDVKPPEVITQLKAGGVNVELVEEPIKVEDVPARITSVGKILGREVEAAKLNEELAADMKAFEARKAELGDKVKKKVVFMYLRGPQVTFVMGSGTGVGQILEATGATNVMGQVGYTAPITAEALIAAQPDAIVVFQHGIESVGGVEGLLKLSGVAETPAGKNKRIVMMDDSYLGGMTNRTGKAALDLLNALQGEGVVKVESRK